jgi:hypothetical protein
MAVHELTSNGNAIAPSVVMQCRIRVLLLLLPGSYITANGFGQFFTLIPYSNLCPNRYYQ